MGMKQRITRHRERGWSADDGVDQLLATVPTARDVLVPMTDGTLGVDPHAAHEHRIVFCSMATRFADGQWGDAIIINGTLFCDRNVGDAFCSELFLDLTGEPPHVLIEELAIDGRKFLFG